MKRTRKPLLEQIEWMFPLKGRWLRYLFCLIWFCVGLAMVAVASILMDPNSLVLTLMSYLGYYIIVRTVIYAASGK